MFVWNLYCNLLLDFIDKSSFMYCRIFDWFYYCVQHLTHSKKQVLDRLQLKFNSCFMNNLWCPNSLFIAILVYEEEIYLIFGFEHLVIPHFPPVLDLYQTSAFSFQNYAHIIWNWSILWMYNIILKVKIVHSNCSIWFSCENRLWK